MALDSNLNFIDVFSGAGGLSCGMEMAGLNCVLGVEMDKHASKTFAHNHKNAVAYCGDIHDLTKKELQNLIGDTEVHAVVGGPPCQGFSTAGLGDPNDMRNSLFKEFVRLVKITSPHFVVIENVTGLLAKKNEQTLRDIFKQFEKLGFALDVQVMSAEQYSVPEKRRRTIIIGTKINDEARFPLPHSKIVTVGDALKSLKARGGKIHNHDLDQTALKSKIDEKRLARIPEGKGIRYKKDEEAYLPPSLRLGVDWDNILENRFRQTKFQRLDRKLPSPTIMTHRHSYYHPVENRYLTQREAAKLQSFPNDFVFHGPISAQWRQIGNAVPPLLGKAIGKSLLEMYADADHSKGKGRSKKLKTTNIQKIRKSAFSYRNARKK